MGFSNSKKISAIRNSENKYLITENKSENSEHSFLQCCSNESVQETHIFNKSPNINRIVCII